MNSLAKELELKADHYSRAFQIAARICRTRLGDTPEADIMEEIFLKKALLEADLRNRLAADPEGTLKEEGLA